MTYLQVGNFEEVLRGVPKIGSDVHQAVNHVNLVALRDGKTKTQTPNHSAAEVRFGSSDRALKLVSPPAPRSSDVLGYLPGESNVEPPPGIPVNMHCPWPVQTEDFGLSGSLFLAST